MFVNLFTLLYFLVFGSIAYLLMCVDPDDKGFLPWLHRTCERIIYRTKQDYFADVQSLLRELMMKFGCGFLIRWVEALFHYICLTNHPLVQIFYVFVAGGGFTYYVIYGLFVYFDDELIGSYHYYPGFCSAFFAYWSYYMACSTDPGKVTKQNTKRFQKEHKYDGILYEKKRMCKTCKVQKPARSKHCRVCNICVSKFDHHCIWIKQCVGQRNYKYFLMYLSSHAILTGYGWIAGFYILFGLVEKDQLWDKQFFLQGSDEVFKPTYYVIFQFLMQRHEKFIFIVFLSFIMSITLSCFFFYHLWLVWSGVTTNEKFRVTDYINYHYKKIQDCKKIIKTCEESEKEISEMTQEDEDILIERENAQKKKREEAMQAQKRKQKIIKKKQEVKKKMEKDSQGKQEEGRDKPDGKAKVEFTNDDFFDPNEDKNKKGNTEPKQKEKVVKAEESKPVEKPKKPAITFEQRKKRSLRQILDKKKKFTKQLKRWKKDYKKVQAYKHSEGGFIENIKKVFSY